MRLTPVLLAWVALFMAVIGEVAPRAGARTSTVSWHTIALVLLALAWILR